MNRRRRSILFAIEVAFGMLVLWLLWTSFETGRQCSVGWRRNRGLAVYLSDGRLGVVYQASPSGRGGEFVFEVLAVPATLMREGEPNSEYLFYEPHFPEPPTFWRARWASQPPVRPIRYNTFKADMPAWPFAVLAAVPLTRRVARSRRASLRREGGQCVYCGYLVRDLPVCPECGNAREAVASDDSRRGAADALPSS